MKMICDVPDEVIKCIKDGMWCGSNIATKMITNGIPLPKGHGRLMILSEDAIKRERVPVDCSCQLWISDIGLLNATVAVIEADQAESETEEKGESEE